MTTGKADEVHVCCMNCGNNWCWLCGTGEYTKGAVFEHISSVHGGFGFRRGDRPAGTAAHRANSMEQHLRRTGAGHFVHWLLEPLQKITAILDLESVTTALHALTRLSMDEDGLLTDIGAIENLVGQRTAMRIDARARKHGFAAMRRRPMDRPLTVEGVGSGCQSATETACITTCTPDHEVGTYEAPLIPDSDLPALWGLRSIAAKRGLIDAYNQRIYLVGEGGYNLQCSPGTIHYELETAPSGHLMLPVTCYGRKRMDGSDEVHGVQREKPHAFHGSPGVAWAPDSDKSF
jgi:hypothetical protein